MAQVGVNDADHRRARDLEARDHRRAEPHLAGAMQDGDAILSGKIVGDAAGAVWRVVVDDHEVAVDPGGGVAGKQRVDQIWEAFPFVVGGHDDRERGWRCGDDGQG